MPNYRLPGGLAQITVNGRTYRADAAGLVTATGADAAAIAGAGGLVDGGAGSAPEWSLAADGTADGLIGPDGTKATGNTAIAAAALAGGAAWQNSEAVTYNAAIVAAGGSISMAAMQAVDALISDGKRSGWWAKVLDMGVFAGNDLTSALVKLKAAAGTATSLTNNNFVAADYSEETGLFSGANNTNKWCGTGVVPSTLSLSATDISFGVSRLDSTYTNTNTGHVMGLNPASGSTLLHVGEYSLGLDVDGGHAPGKGVVAYTQTSALGYLAFNGVRGSGCQSPPATSGTLDTELTLFKSVRSSATYYCCVRLGMYFIGQYMTTQQAVDLTRAVMAFERRINRVQQKAGRLLAFGDSITQGEGATLATRAKTGYAPLLAKYLGMEHFNAGAPASKASSDFGYTVYSGLNRYTEALQMGPAAVVIMLGTNDCNADGATNGTSATATAVKNNLNTIASAFTAQNIKTVIASIPYNTTSNATRLGLYWTACKDAAVLAGVPFVDVYNAMLDTGSPGSYLTDANHPNDAGHALIAKFVAEAMRGRLIRILKPTFGAIAAGAVADKTVAVYGATINAAGVGNPVSLALPDTVQSGLVFNAFVSAADTVTIRCTNTTAGSLTPVDGFFEVAVYIPT